LENILYKIRCSDCCFGFTKGISSPLVKNAENHRCNLFILKTDLKDFFPSICSKRVWWLFKSIGYNDEVASLLTNICTCDDGLPQGAVTSPYLANLICSHLDIRLQKYCAKREISYSRYADDLTFSCNNKETLVKSYKILSKIVVQENFTINTRKTHLLTPSYKREVVGITISDEKLKASKDMKRIVRSMIHKSIISGDYSCNDKIRGYIAYINSIENDYKSKIIQYIGKFYSYDIVTDMQAVVAFNSNKLFAELNDMIWCDELPF